MADSSGFSATSSTYSFKLVHDSIADSTCYYCVLIVLLWYDYFLTLDEEVQYMWKGRISPASILFYVLRYSALLSTVSECFSAQGLLKQSVLSCYVFESFVMAFIILLYSSAATFAAMRVYAICARNVPISVLVLLLGLANPAIYLYAYTQTAPLTITSMTALSCGALLAPDPGSRYSKWLLAARASAIAADALVLVLTWAKTTRTMGLKPIRMMPLTSVLLADGTIYFACLLILNVVGLVVWQDRFYSNPMTMWIGILTAILTYRFMLDLRRAASSWDDSRSSQVTTIAFTGPTSTSMSESTIADLEMDAVPLHFALKV